MPVLHNRAQPVCRPLQESSGEPHATHAQVHEASSNTFPVPSKLTGDLCHGALGATCWASRLRLGTGHHTGWVELADPPAPPTSPQPDRHLGAASLKQHGCAMPPSFDPACQRSPHFPAPPRRMACRMRPPPGTGWGPLNRPSCAWPLARASCDRMSCAAAQFSRLPAHVCTRRAH